MKGRERERDAHEEKEHHLTRAVGDLMATALVIVMELALVLAAVLVLVLEMAMAMAM